MAEANLTEIHQNVRDITGETYNRFTVIRYAGKHRRGSAMWLCRCICGNERIVLTSEITRTDGKERRSCGCLARELSSKRAKTHGLSRTDEAKIWERMIARCHDSSNPAYANYGGRGIVVCQRWKESVEAFISDMGPRPNRDYSIDRYPDKNGNYEPGNCRWATDTQQMRNTRSNRLLTFQGKTLCITEWTERLGFKHYTIQNRLRYGWTVEEALSTPEAAPGRKMKRKFIIRDN